MESAEVRAEIPLSPQDLSMSLENFPEKAQISACA